MKTKICTKCKKELPNNENYFHLDSSKVKLGHLVVLASACKVCKNEKKRIQSIEYRNKIASEFGSVYQKRKLTDVDIDGYPTTFSIVDKDSITNVYNKIKF